MAWNRQDLTTAFQSALGREPSDSELAFLGPYLEAGHITPYEVGKYLQGTPEAQQSRLAQQQTAYSDILSKNNSTILNQAADAANSRFAQAGRQFSSGQTNSVIQAGQQLAAQQSPMLANFYGQGQYGLNQDYTSEGQGSLSRAYGLADQSRMRQWQLNDYDRQKNDYNDFLRGQQGRNLQSGLLSGAFGLAGAGIGALGMYAARPKSQPPDYSGYV